VTSAQLDVYGLGQCCLDYLARIPGYPPPNSKCEIVELVVEGGGPVATALVALARWGMRCAVAGVIGGDRVADEIRDSLTREGVDASELLVRNDGASQFAFVVAEPGGGRRTIFWRRPTGLPPRADELDLDRIGSSRVLLTDGLFPDASIAAAAAAREAGAEVIVDAGSLRDGMLELAGLADHFLASETFARSFAPGASPTESCRRLAELGPAVAGVTLGDRGWVALADGLELRGAAYPVDAIDTTGCGDAFHAGYAFGLLQGWPVEHRLDLGAWVASRVALALGGRAGLPPIRDYPGPTATFLGQGSSSS
jgi:sulfofructose kinase